MQTVQMTLDADLIAAVDKAARKLGTTRSGFTRQALQDALAKLRTRELEKRYLEGYRRKPVKKGEFDLPGSEQAWPDE